MFSEPPSLNHLKKMTTPIGIVQHSLGHNPDLRFGYSIDDSARALIAVLQYHELYGDDESLELAEIYLGYLEKAQLPSGFFHNFSDFRGVFVDKQGSADSLGRVIWSLGYAMSSNSSSEELKKRSYAVYKRIPLSLGSLLHLRSKAFALTGFSLKEDIELASIFADSLVSSFQKNSKELWRWFENKLTYSNAILPYSLLLYANKTGSRKSGEAAMLALDFLLEETMPANVPVPVGQNGWYVRDKEKALFDQQVVDVADTILACIEAYQFKREKKYLSYAEVWYSWFTGNNLGSRQMINTKSGGIYDGLKENSVNKNQGAESIICYLIAYHELARVNNS